MNIRVYKIIYANKRIGFSYRTKEDTPGQIRETLRNVARKVKILADSHLVDEANFPGKTSIDFFPFHDIECRQSLAPCRCLALTEQERQKFWEHFNENA